MSDHTLVQDLVDEHFENNREDFLGLVMTEVCDFCDTIQTDITKTNANSDICGECKDSGKWNGYLDA